MFIRDTKNCIKKILLLIFLLTPISVYSQDNNNIIISHSEDKNFDDFIFGIEYNRDINNLYNIGVEFSIDNNNEYDFIIINNILIKSCNQFSVIGSFEFNDRTFSYGIETGLSLNNNTYLYIKPYITDENFYNLNFGVSYYNLIFEFDTDFNEFNYKIGFEINI